MSRVCSQRGPKLMPHWFRNAKALRLDKFSCVIHVTELSTGSRWGWTSHPYMAFSLLLTTSHNPFLTSGGNSSILSHFPGMSGCRSALGRTWCQTWQAPESQLCATECAWTPWNCPPGHLCLPKPTPASTSTLGLHSPPSLHHGLMGINTFYFLLLS